MPELPDVEVYVESLQRKIRKTKLLELQIINPFVLRTFDIPKESLKEKTVVEISRLAKRIVIEFEGDLFCVMHLMISGRLYWKERAAAINRKLTHAIFKFKNGELHFVEHGTKKRASIYLLKGRESVLSLHPGGKDALEISRAEFEQAMKHENHTIKRALTDQRFIGGIGNAYSDEILFDAKISPFVYTNRLTDEEIDRLYASIKKVMLHWLELIRKKAGDFPGKVTAFQEEMAVHGKYNQPCPECAAPIQRIIYAENESNYCPGCQTGGKIYADRSLSRLLKSGWPKTLDELENSSIF